MMKRKEKQQEETISSNIMAGKLKNRQKAVVQRMPVGIVLLACFMLFLGGCSDKAVSFTLDTQKETDTAANTDGQDVSADESSAQGVSGDTGQVEVQGGISGQISDQESLQTGTGEAAAEKTIWVYVCGAVKEPGVVELPEGSRAKDALEAAGGFREDARQDYVNLAARVEDEQKLYFPTVEEAKILLEQSANSGMVNINTAGEEKLCTLPGIGASRAGDIIAYREAHGAFENKEDIMQVPGIKESLYEELCDYIMVE